MQTNIAGSETAVPNSGFPTKLFGRRLARAAGIVAMTFSVSTVCAQTRSIDGVGNNVENPKLGSARTALSRLFSPMYEDGVSELFRGTRPNPREVSNIVCRQDHFVAEPSGASGFLFQWGQFLDHDLDLTPPHKPAEPSPIELDDDPVFVGISEIPFLRSAYDMASVPREQKNEITSFIDASNVYGSDTARQNALRANDGSGELATSAHDLLPYNEAGLPNDPASADFYLAGDVRANEQVALTALHTLFMREHNRLAREIRKDDASLRGDEVYERARARVGAMMQVITYKEFLPLLLGSDALVPYQGYDPTVDPSIANEFSTAAFRFGHSAIQPVLHRLKRNGQPIPQGPLSLRDAFFTRSELDPSIGQGIEPLLRGLALMPAQAVDVLVIDDVRNFLFNPGPGQTGIDLVALNIQRGRDHGLASYASARDEAGLGAVMDFEDVTTDSDIQMRLASVYGSVDDVDLWVGGLAEDRVPGALVGPLFHYIIRDQFERLRDGDRFWYQRVFSGEELAELEATRLADIITRNSKVDSSEIQQNVFIVP